jgi:signal transduction histidine kinase
MEPSVLTAIQHPLTALVTSMQLLEEDFDELTRAQVRRRIAAMHTGAFWLHELIENLQCAATIEHGRLEIQRRPLSLTGVVEEILPVVMPILSQQAQHLDPALDEGTPDVLADPRRMSQVMVNLISNASEQSEAGGTIRLRITPRDEEARVVVADRGPALPVESAAAALESLSRPGQQGSNGAAALGLAVARWIIEAHGGKVGAQNRPGGGARFWFQLPAA